MAPNSARTLVPFSTRVTITNIGDAAALGDATVEFLLSEDQIVDDGDILLETVTRPLELGIGEDEMFMDWAIRISDFIAPGFYNIVARVRSDNVLEIRTDNNTDDDGDGLARELAWRFGTFDGRRRPKIRFRGADYRMSGAGFGEIVNVAADGAVSLDFTNTDRRSSVKVKPRKGETSTIDDINVDGRMRKLDLAKSDLHGDITVIDTLTTMKIRNVLGPSTITIGNTHGDSGDLKFTAKSVNGLNIISPTACIRKIRVDSWSSPDGTRSRIEAVSLASFKSKGFVDHLDVLASRGIKKFAAAGMRSTNLLVGTTPGVDLPGSADDFVNQEGEIRSIKLKGIRRSNEPTFADSRIAAWVVRSAKLKTIQADNTGSTFGVAAHEIRKIKIANSDLVPPATPGLPAGDGDFVIQLV